MTTENFYRYEEVKVGDLFYNNEVIIIVYNKTYEKKRGLIHYLWFSKNKKCGPGNSTCHHIGCAIKL